MLAGILFGAEATADQLVQVAAVDRVCSVPYRLRADEALHIHCYTPELIGRPSALIETGAADVQGQLVQSYDKPAGVWVLMRGKGRGVARVTLVAQ